MAERLLQHRHCRNCDKAVPADERFCNEECMTAHRLMMKKKKNQLLLVMFIAVVMMVFALVSSARW